MSTAVDARSERNLAYVHPDLCSVIRAAAQTPQPFTVVYGVRTEAAERVAVASGHSHTTHSRHLPQSHENLLACAVDVAALTANQVDYAKGREAAVFGQIAAQIKAAAQALNIPIQWGGEAVGAWTPGVVSTFRDWGHFQLPWETYP